MVVRETWPYVDKNHPCESDRHVRLKNLAVYWLLQRGFTPGDIEQEHVVDRNGGRGSTAQTDIYANNGEREYYIECETDFHHTYHSLSFGGSIPAKSGKNVLVFDSEEIHEIRIDDSGAWHFDVVSSLPFVDLEAY